MGDAMKKMGLKTHGEVMAYLGKDATSRQVITACKIFNEWNSENPTSEIELSVLRANPHFKSEQDQNVISGRCGTGATAHDQAGLAIARDLLGQLCVALSAFLERNHDFRDGFAAEAADPGPTGAAKKILREANRLLERPELLVLGRDGTSEAVTELITRYQDVRARVLPPAEEQRKVYSAARRLRSAGLSGNRDLSRVIELFNDGKPDQFKGVVGEYLGVLAAEEALAGTTHWDVVHQGLLVLEIKAVTPDTALAKPGAELDHQSAPQLMMQHNHQLYGTVVGEIDALLCRTPPGQPAQVVAILECKAGRLSSAAVAAQLQRLAANCTQVSSNPNQYCLARREHNEYVDCNANYQLASLTAAEVYTAGPPRKSHQFDIVLDLTSEEIDALLCYLALVPPDHWGDPPVPNAPDQPTRDQGNTK